MRAPVWIAGLFAAFGTASTALAAPPELAFVPNPFVESSYSELGAGESLESPDARCSLCMQDDGNLVLKWRERVLWNTKTAGTTDTRLRLQNDGNLVLYGKKDGVEKRCGSPVRPGRSARRASCANRTATSCCLR
jgi:hypothetical protein